MFNAVINVFTVLYERIGRREFYGVYHVGVLGHICIPVIPAAQNAIFSVIFIGYFIFTVIDIVVKVGNAFN